RVPAAAEPRPLSRLPGLLLARGPAPRDRALVGLPRPDRRRFRLALPLPGRLLPRLPRLPGAAQPTGEPLLARPQRSPPRSGGGPREDHRPSRLCGRADGGRGAARLAPRARLGEARRPLGDDRFRLDRPQHLLLRALPLASVRAPGREGLYGQRVPPARSLRALAVSGLRRLDLAR